MKTQKKNWAEINMSKLGFAYLVKRSISISLADSENIVKPMDDTFFDCCIRSPE